MDTIILNFKKKEIVAASKEEALDIASRELFQINGNATPAFEKWKQKQNGGITERDIKAFMLNYLAENSKYTPGIGYFITINPAVKDTRQRPYKVYDVKGNGKRKYGPMFTWYDKETGQEICKSYTNKFEAKKMIKDMIKNGQFKGKAICEKSKRVINGTSIVATAEYVPSKNTKKGTWLVFGVEA